MSRKYVRIISKITSFFTPAYSAVFNSSIHSVALFIGLYAYGIFLLGVTGNLFILPLFLLTILFGVCTSYYFSKKNWRFFKTIPVHDKFSITAFILLVILAGVNLLGAVGPEYSFDAVWYHLTLPKLYLTNHAISHIPGGLFYYSDMPKLGELLYVAALAFHSEIVAKIIHYVFGLLICIHLYQYARKWYPQRISLLVVAIFYGNLVVAWESTVAYIDLIRTFYEFLAVTVFINWISAKKDSYLYVSALFLGFAITTKLLALGSLFILSILGLYVLKSQGYAWPSISKKIITFVCIALLVPFPWFVFSYINTGNPVYPFFTALYPTHSSITLLNPAIFLKDFFQLFTSAADPVSPVYLMFLPFLLFFPFFRKEIKMLTLYSLGVCIMWYITPRTGGGRFILPYLPVLSLIVGEILSRFSKQKKYYSYNLLSVVMVFVILISTILYRGITNSKYIPYVIGKESKQTFLINHLNFSFGDFIDIDNGIQKQLKPSDIVLLVGFHNEYYVAFPHIDISYIKKNDRFTYIATQRTTLPGHFQFAKKVYDEPRTGVVLYYVGEQRWNIN